MTITVDQKGSVPLPEEILRDSGVQPGDTLDISSEGDGIVLRKVSSNPGESLLDILHGLKGLPLSERGRTTVRDVVL